MADKHPKKNPLKKDKRGRFAVGNSGGRGRPKGSLDRRTAPFRQQIDAALPSILDAVIKAAQGGDIQACRILLDKSLPNARPTDMPRALPIHGNTLTDKASSVIQATVAGAVSVDEAAHLLQALGAVARIVETDQLIARIEKVEQLAERGSKN